MSEDTKKEEKAVASTNKNHLSFTKKVRPQITFDYEGHDYVLRRASAGPIAEFKELQLQAVTFHEDGSRKMARTRDVMFKLVSECAFAVISRPGKKDKEVPVTMNELKEWDWDVVDALYDKARELCDISTETMDEAREKVQDVFDEGNPPCSFEALRTWVLAQGKESLGSFYDYFTETKEEAAKNS